MDPDEVKKKTGKWTSEGYVMIERKAKPELVLIFLLKIEAYHMVQDEQNYLISATIVLKTKNIITPHITDNDSFNST